jgi:hypothetical protein
MCRNPRHSLLHKGISHLTLQEQKGLLSFQEQMASLADSQE